MDQDRQNPRFDGSPAAWYEGEGSSSSSSASSSSPSPTLSNEEAFSHSCNNIKFRKGLGRIMQYQTNKLPCYSSITRNAADSFEKPKCGRCGEVFGSMKALYGHMRSHDLQTIRPWTPNYNSSSSNICLSWSITGRRGRMRIKDKTYALNLMLFANSENSTTASFDMKKRKIHELCDANDDHCSNHVGMSKKKMLRVKRIKDIKSCGSNCFFEF